NTPGTAQQFQLKATSTSLPKEEADSNTFEVSPSQGWSGSPGVKFDGTVKDQQQGVPFDVTVDVLHGGVLTSDYDQVAHVLGELRDANGNPLPNDPSGPVLAGVQTKNMPSGGKVTFKLAIQQVSKPTMFTLLALLDLNAQTFLSNQFTDPPPA